MQQNSSTFKKIKKYLKIFISHHRKIGKIENERKKHQFHILNFANFDSENHEKSKFGWSSPQLSDNNTMKPKCAKNERHRSSLEVATPTQLIFLQTNPLTAVSKWNTGFWRDIVFMGRGNFFLLGWRCPLAQASNTGWKLYWGNRGMTVHHRNLYIPVFRVQGRQK